MPTLSQSDAAPVVDPRAFVDAEACLGPGCVIKSGAHICRGVKLERGVYIGPNVVFVERPLDAGGLDTHVERDVSVGANATIYFGIVIGEKAVIRPGAVVTRTVPPGAIVEGNPASITGYVDAVHDTVGIAALGINQAKPSVQQTVVKGVTLHNFPVIPDMRGSLTAYEFEKQIPFSVKRSFMVFDVPSREVRGEHAHRKCHEFLVCARGSCAVVADDGTHKIEVDLDAPNLGIYLPPMVWRVHYKYSPDAILVAFASDYYDAADYIRSYSDFLATVGCGNSDSAQAK